MKIKLIAAGTPGVSSLPFSLALAIALFGAATGQAQPVVLTPLHQFTSSPDGSQPVGSLIFGPDNALYGTTFGGGTNTASPGGTIFKTGRDGSGYTVLRSFGAHDTGSSGQAKEIGLSVAWGRDGSLYGTTAGNGSSDAGTVFKMSSDGSGFTVLYSFPPPERPLNLIQASDGWLYGSSYDVFFKLDTNGNNYAVLYSYTGSSIDNGSYGKLLQGSDGALYGTAYSNGTNNGGTVFKLDLNGDVFTILHSFPSAAGDGLYPYSGLVQGSDGALYGTTESGGTNGFGTVFKLGTNGSGYQVLYNFANTPDGEVPEGSLVVGLGNVLYGTTYGGSQNPGTIFTLNLDGSGYKVLYGFTNSSPTVVGKWPLGGLVQGPASGGSGVLYGTTTYGGGLGGYVFAMLVNPPLTITPVVNQTGSNQVMVSWPAWALNYVLQTTTNLASPSWSTASNGVPIAGILLTNSLPAAYYRLAWPQ
jgi:uncharacterized repeat protein (TIGR03803 family)